MACTQIIVDRASHVLSGWAEMPSIQNWKLSIRVGFFVFSFLQTAETKYQKCLKSLWPSTANWELCPVNSNFYLLCQHCLHTAAFFSVFPVYHALGDSFTGTGQKGEPEHIPNPLQVQNTKSLCCGLLKNTLVQARQHASKYSAAISWHGSHSHVVCWCHSAA